MFYFENGTKQKRKPVQSRNWQILGRGERSYPVMAKCARNHKTVNCHDNSVVKRTSRNQNHDSIGNSSANCAFYFQIRGK